MFGIVVVMGLCSPVYALEQTETEALLLEEVSDIASRGAPGLALKLLEKLQTAEPGSASWLRLERQRIELMKIAGDWPAVVSRLESFPGAWNEAAGRWASTELVRAYLEQGRGEVARKRLRELLWGEAAATPLEQSVWRRLVISSYLQEGRNEDAFRALTRYSQDYGADDAALLILRARVLLQSGRPNDVEAVLGHEQGREAQLLRLTARLRGKHSSPKAVLAEAMALASRLDSSRSLHQEAWALVAETALAAGHHPGRILALERIFGSETLSPALVSVFDLNMGRYWDACLEYGRQMANRDRLLLGQDEVWLATIARDVVSTPVRARALLALMIDQSDSLELIDKASLQLLDVLQDGPGGPRLVLRLFTEGRVFEDPAMMPAGLRHRLIDLAVDEGQIALAAKLSAHEQGAPQGSERFSWQLRKSRLLLLGGEQEAALAQLQTMLGAATTLEDHQIDALLQVIFDVQALGLDEAALGLFRRLLSATASAQLKREIYYWMADSYKAMSDPLNAARIYLKSAGLLDPYSMDRWAQTARYQAAEQLILASLRADARAVYQNLLNVTKDATQKAVLQSKIQRLKVGVH